MVFLWWKCLVGDRQCVKQNTQLTSERQDEEEPQAYPSRMKEHHLIQPILAQRQKKKRIHFVQFKPLNLKKHSR